MFFPLNSGSSIHETSISKCGLYINYCRETATCKPKEIITMDRCFWEELQTGISICKNDEIIEYLSITLTVGPYQTAFYGYWGYMNNAIGKKSIFLNTVTNNFLEGTN
jgi:hypothetical protein